MGGFLMAKYSFEFKMRVVNEYLQKKSGYGLLAQKHNISSKSIIAKWVAVYRKYGLQGLKRSRHRKTYSFQFKQHAVELYLSTEISYQDLALLLDIKSHGMLVNWVQRYRAVGVEGLKPQRKGRRPKVPDINTIQLTSADEQAERLKQLEEENRKLRIEVAYLKEARRLRLAEEEQKRKQGLSTVSEEPSD
jgi:transposase